MMKQILTFLCGIIFLAAFTISSADTPVNQIAAIVNNSVITQTQLNHAISTFKKQMKQAKVPLPSNKMIRSHVIQQLIDQKLQLQLANKTGIRVSQAELNQAIQHIAARNHMTADQMYQKLRTQKWNVATFRKQIRNELTVQKLQSRDVASNISISQQEVDDALSVAKSSVHSAEQYHVRDLLVTIPDMPTPEQIQTARANAEQLLTKLQAGADFAKLAAANSSGETAFQGGDLGWRTLNQLPNVFAQHIPKMKLHQFAGPIHTPNGFHIIQLMGVKGQTGPIQNETEMQMIFLSKSAKVSSQQAISTMQSIKNQLNSGTDFATLARKYSQDSKTSKLGGYLGWANPGQLGPAVSQGIQHLKAGDLSNPIETPKGCYLIKILGKRSIAKTTPEERGQIEQAIFQQKLQSGLETFVSNLRSQAYIKVMG